MPIKELQFSFKITVDALARALAESNHGMDIQVLGTQPVDLDQSTEQPKLLPPTGRSAPRKLIIEHMRSKPNVTMSTSMVVIFLSQYGFDKDCAYRTVHNMKMRGELRRLRNGFRLTKAALHG